MSFLSDTAFSSLLSYSPRGKSDLAEKSRRIVRAVKTDSSVGTTRILSFAASRILELRPDIPALRLAFPAGAVAVPVPRATPRVPDGLWPTMRLCEELRAAGVVDGIRPLIERTRPVAKSATAARGQRPLAEAHAASLAVADEAHLGEQGPFCLVDDVITRGATLVAAAAVLRAAFPQASILAFALVRTISDGDLPGILAPVAGEIRLRPDGSTHRDP